jgi:hypothetical protein
MSLDASHIRNRWPAVAVLLIALGAAEPRSSGQSPARPAAKGDDRAGRLAEMKQLAGSFQAASIHGSTRTPIPLAPEPLYRWTDPTRENNDGALWIWRSTGRPIAVVAIELYPQNPAFGTVWALEFTSLSTGPLEVAGGEHFDKFYADMFPPRADGTLRWAPVEAGIAFREVPDAPAPATTEAGRLRQMRELAKRFSAREFYQTKSQDYTLRLIPHPIDRYADAAAGLVDGVIFAFANGTNPEVFLLIEARRQGTSSPTWSYAAAPLARAKVTPTSGSRTSGPTRSRRCNLPRTRTSSPGGPGTPRGLDRFSHQE